MPSYHIRRATIADTDRLTDLLIGLQHFRRLEGVPRAAVLAQVSRHLGLCLADDSHAVYIAETGEGAIAAYAAVHWLPYLFLPGPEGYISELFVAEAARGQGVGARLLATIAEEACDRGCSRLSLLNMRGRESYQRGFYVRHGWEERPDAANFVLEIGS